MRKKKHIIGFTVVGMMVMLVFASCSLVDNDDGKGKKRFVISALFDGDGNNPNCFNIKWKMGDEFMVAPTNDEGPAALFSLMTGTGRKKAFFYTSNFEYEPNYTAAYPYAEASIKGRSVEFAIPAEQHLGTVAGNIANGANPMATVATSINFRFKHVYGSLGIPLFGGGYDIVHVSGIRLTALDTCEALWGTCTATIEGEDADAIVTSTTVNEAPTRNVLTLTCDLDLSPLSEVPTWFYIMLPPGTLASGFKIEVLDDDKVLFEKSTESDLAMAERAVMKRISTPISIENTPAITDTLQHQIFK